MSAKHMEHGVCLTRRVDRAACFAAHKTSPHVVDAGQRKVNGFCERTKSTRDSLSVCGMNEVTSRERWTRGAFIGGEARRDAEARNHEKYA